MTGFAEKALDSFIESQIFFPDKHMAFSPTEFGLEFEDIRFRAADGTRLHGWMIPARESRAMILFCHGNAGNISHRLDNVRRLIDLGMSVFIFDYRGYGLSEGRAGEKGMYIDSDAAYDTAQDTAAVAGSKLVIFGRSLGGVAAVYLGAARDPSGIILESTFTNLGAMAAVHFPVPMAGKTLAKRFDSLGRIARVKAPLLFTHGDCDDIVPFALGKQLYDAAPEPKEFYEISSAGHNDTYLVGGEAYFDKLRRFIDGLPTR